MQAPLRLAAYHVDERRTVWDHLQDLARLAGCETSADDQGRLRFRPLPGATGGGGLGGLGAGVPAEAANVASGLLGRGSTKRLRHGAELVAWRAQVGPEPGAVPDVVPNGNSSGQGLGSWHVVLKEPDGGAPSGLVLVPAAR